jgi:tetratricopeptide (TPR) repeat protein
LENLLKYSAIPLVQCDVQAQEIRREGVLRAKLLGLFLSAWVVLAAVAIQASVPITVDYPANGSLFPPEFPPPTFIWRDPAPEARFWRIEVKLGRRSNAIQVTTPGEPMRIGEIDERCVSETNELPRLTPELAAARTWKPDPEIWSAIKKGSINKPAKITINGFADEDMTQLLSVGHVTIQTSRDPVGAPIFYRDVPLMPTRGETGIIKPLASHAIPLIAWRLRNVGNTSSTVLMEGVHSCANCHSFSKDGKTMGLDVDGPQNDKGLYALVPIQPETSIKEENVVAWSTFEGKLGGKLRVGFMSQISPDGQYVVTTINDPGPPQTASQRRKNPQDLTGNYYVANFSDYRFLQVFYATRGILAWYSKATGRLEPLPGADDPRYVHCNATWSSDGKYLVFCRAEARDANPPGGRRAEFANDPNETAIQYDLYRIPFNGGKGGTAEPVTGASDNGMSNTFARVSPDGRWIVYVQCRNGQLMRPDSQLYIVPFEGGQARRMNCNTPLMNSWHSFSPNGRWLVFSSKSRTPYTQMFLTHIDKKGQDTPPILIEDATAANRAVNLPEFVNLPEGSLLKMKAPVTEFYEVFDIAAGLAEKGEHEAAAMEWRRAAELGPNDVRVYHNLGVELAALGRLDEAVEQYRKALEIDSEYEKPYVGLGLALGQSGRIAEAISFFEKALALDPEDPLAHSNYAAALIDQGRPEQAIFHCQRALEKKPEDAEARGNLAAALAMTGRVDEAIPEFYEALKVNPESSDLHYNLGFALLHRGRGAEAIPHLQKALAADPQSADLHGHLGMELASAGRFDEAITHLTRLAELAPQSAEAVATLAAAYAGAGRFHEALQAARRAFDLASRQNNPALADAIAARIAAYQAGRR